MIRLLAALILTLSIAATAATAQPAAAPVSVPMSAPAPTPTPNLITYTGQSLDYRANYVTFTTGDAFAAVDAPRIIDALTGQPTSVRPQAKMFAQATFDPVHEEDHPAGDHHPPPVNLGEPRRRERVRLVALDTGARARTRRTKHHRQAGRGRV